MTRKSKQWFHDFKKHQTC